MGNLSLADISKRGTYSLPFFIKGSKNLSILKKFPRLLASLALATFCPLGITGSSHAKRLQRAMNKRIFH